MFVVNFTFSIELVIIVFNLAVVILVPLLAYSLCTTQCQDIIYVEIFTLTTWCMPLKIVSWRIMTI